MKLTREFKIGIIVTISFALLYWGFNFLKGKDVFSSERVFRAVYVDIGGLERANPVTINGVNVGQVRNIEFTKDGKTNVVIEIVIKDNLDIPIDSKATIISPDLLGSKAVLITLGTSSELAVSGDTLASEVEISIKEEVNRQLAPIKNKAESLMSSIDSVLTMLQGLFSSGNTENFSKSVEHIANTVENIESVTGTIDTLLLGQKGKIENIVTNIDAIITNFKNNEEQLNHILANFSSISDTLAAANFAETMNNVNRTMAETADITAKINRGEGSLGLLINDDSLYINLENTSRELNLLLEDIRLNPKKYVRFSVF